MSNGSYLKFLSMSYLSMPSGLKYYFETEPQAYKSAFKAKELRKACRHLERAQIRDKNKKW